MLNLKIYIDNEDYIFEIMYLFENLLFSNPACKLTVMFTY